MTGPLPYFAYGSNLSTEQMAQRCPGAVPLGTAMLVGMRFLINRRGVATIAAGDPAERVHGLLWEVSEAHVDALDGYEGVADGRYLKETVLTVAPGQPADGDGVRVEAIVYRDPVVELGDPREGYLERVLAGAEAAGLPVNYIDQVLRPFARPDEDDEVS